MELLTLTVPLSCLFTFIADKLNPKHYEYNGQEETYKLSLFITFCFLTGGVAVVEEGDIRQLSVLCKALSQLASNLAVT